MTLSSQVTYLIQDILEVPCWTGVCVDTTYQHIIISIQTTVNGLQLLNNLKGRQHQKLIVTATQNNSHMITEGFHNMNIKIKLYPVTLTQDMKKKLGK